MKKLLTIKDVAGLVGVTYKTLHRWDEEGRLPCLHMTKGMRRYDSETVEKFLGQYNPEPIKDRPVCVYARVSSHEQKQKGDLDRQSQRISEYCAKKKYTIEHIIKDVGSGLSDTRHGFVKLMEMVIEKKI